MIVFMYIFCLLAWGLNFIVIKIQGTPVSLEVSLTYRLIGSAVIFIFFAFIVRSKMRFIPKDLLFMAVFGVCNFALSYLLLYYATIWSSAAVVTLVFSMKTVLTPVALNLFLKTKLNAKILYGGGVGVFGVGILVYPILIDSDNSSAFNGVLLAFLGTLLTSIGDVSSARNSRRSINPIYSNTVGFIVASALLLVISISQGHKFDFPISYSYISSLLYLTIIASVCAWMFYLRLVEKIGPSKSSYMVALFPAVGGIASIIIGDSEPTLNLFLGCVLCSMGAALALLPKYSLKIYEKSP